MKKSLFYSMLATTMLFATSCQQDEVFVDGNEAVVQFQISTPEMATRAYSDGTTATNLQWAVYDAQGVRVTGMQPGSKEINGKTNVELKLAKGKSYNVLFWASAEGAPYTVDFDTHTLTVEYDGYSNDEKRDAFYNWYPVEVNAVGEAQVVELRRPFAQLNIGTGDMQDAAAAGVTVATTKVTVTNVYNTLDFKEGSVTGEENVTFDYAAVPTNEIFPVDGYDYLAMNYVLVPADKVVVDKVELTYTSAQVADETRTFTSIPLQRNYRTNIYGDLLTKGVDFIVEIKPAYEDEDGLEKWDGVELSEPTYDDATKTYYISHAAELAYVAQLVNGTLDTDNVTRASVPVNSLKGLTVKLECDIDLGENEWTPIGTSTNQFQGTFDGDGHTVKNLVITGKNSNVGLFGMTTIGEIKNLTIENAKVSGRLNVGVVAGNPYTSKYTNVTVKGHVEVNGMSYVGGVGGKNAYANWENITVDVDAESYVKANSVENGTAYRTYVGGVCGFNGEGGHSFTNIISNINVEGTTCDVGGLFGIAHYGNKFINCVGTGNVKITDAAEAADAEEIGGIAGVWNNGGADVTFTNCKFTGVLETNITEGVDLTNNTIVGKAYSATGTGRLIIDGATAVATSEEMEKVLRDKTEEINILLLSDVTVNIGAWTEKYYFGGENTSRIKIEGNNNTITFKHENTDWNYIRCVNENAKWEINNAKLTNSGANNGPWNRHDIRFYNEVVLNNVTSDKAIALLNDGDLKGVEITEDGDVYCLWITAEGQTVNIDGLTIKSAGRGIKIDEEYVGTPAKVTLNVTDATFTTVKKAAIMVKSVAGADITLENVDIENVAADKDFAVWVDEDAADYADKVVVKGALVKVEGEALAAADTADELVAALESGKDVVLTDDVKIDPAGMSNAYGTTGINVKNGQTIDGGGHILDIKGAGGTWDSGISTTGGLIKNIKVAGSFRGIFVNHNSTHSEKVVLDNVIIDGTTYTISCDQGTGNGLEATNSTFKGWTSYAATLGNAKFTDCSFGRGNGYAYFRPYAPTEFVGCEFEAGYRIDTRAAVTFENCTFDGVALTAENLATLVTNTANATVK